MDVQVKGGKHDSTESITVDKNSSKFFSQVKNVFFEINNWDKLFGNATKFQVVDQEGNEKSAQIQIGDFVKIRIPGPKSVVGDGYDWVSITKIEKTEVDECLTYCIVLSPCSKYGSSDKTAHFFGPDAKNYFIIKKCKNTITAEVHGRNEVPNYSKLGIWDKTRNFFVAHGGIFGFSSLHWKTWTKNILDPTTLEKF